MFRRVDGRSALPRMDLAAQRRRTRSRCQRTIVSRGDQQPQPLAPCFRYHAEQGREQGPVRPVEIRAMRTPPLQDGELVAQDQDLRGLPCLPTVGQPQPRGNPRYQEEHEPQAHDRRSSRPDTPRATQLVRAVDEILGTHNPMADSTPRSPVDLRLDRPTPARMYDYFLGGKDNFAVDRDAAERVKQAIPNTYEIVWENRFFLQRMVRHLAEAGIDQYIDLGADGR
jgi:S-adenosyl methyltransferase